MAKHGRRSVEQRDEPQGLDPEHMAFRLQLKPQHATECKVALEVRGMCGLHNNMGSDMPLQTVSMEYATRYLEQLGVSPARHTLDLVHRNIPLTEKSVTTTLRAKGHVSDELKLAVPPVQYSPRVPKVIHNHAVLQLGLTNQEAARTSSQGPNHSHMQESADVACKATGTMQRGVATNTAHMMSTGDVPGSHFRHMAARYLHPFNLDVTLAHTQLAQLVVDMRPSSAEQAVHGAVHRASSVTLQHQSTLGRRIQEAALTSIHACRRTSECNSSARAVSAKSRRSAGSASPQGRSPRQLRGHNIEVASGWDPELLRLEICEELLQEVDSTPEVVLMLCAQVERALVDWHKHQAPETLKGRLTQAQFQATLELLTDESRVCLFITLLNFMHQEFVRGSPSFPHHLQDKVNKARYSFLQKRNSSLSRSNSCRLAAASGNALAAGMPVVTASSRQQNLEKYDLGYKHWVKQRKRSSIPAVTQQPQQQQQRTLSSPHACIATATHHHHAANTCPALPSSSSPSCLPSSSQTPLPHEASRPCHHQGIQPSVSFMDASKRPGPHPRHRSPSPAETPQPSSQRHLPPALVLASEPQHVGVHAHDSRQTSPSGRGSQPSSPRAAGRINCTAAESNTGFDSCCALSRQSIAPVTLEEATRKSMSQLTTVKALQAALADGEAGPLQLTPQDEQQLQQARLFVLQREFAILFAALRKSRAGMFFTLPVFLVTARLIVHLLFTGLYTLWTRTLEGHQAIQLMDAALENMYDPHGYLQRNLSILQSSPAAVSVMQKYPHKSHEPERLHFADTSPLMRSVMVDPASAGARKLLHQEAINKQARTMRQNRRGATTSARTADAQSAAVAGAEGGHEEGCQAYGAHLLGGWMRDVDGPVKTRLSLPQRQALLQVVQGLLLMDMPPNLAVMGAPAGTTRDAWVSKLW